MKCDLCTGVIIKAHKSKKYGDLTLCKQCHEAVEDLGDPEFDRQINNAKIKRFFARCFVGFLISIVVCFALYCSWFIWFGRPPDAPPASGWVIPIMMTGVATQGAVAIYVACVILTVVSDIIDCATKKLPEEK